jgi:hypothetical protein
MAEDKTTIGVTAGRATLLEQVVANGLFVDQLDAAKFAIALAIRSNIPPGELSNASTKWNVGSFDRDGHLRTVVSALFPLSSTPYRLAEYLIDQGLALLERELQANPELDLTTLQKSLEH